jgi:hypothetical protein
LFDLERVKEQWKEALWSIYKRESREWKSVFLKWPEDPLAGIRLEQTASLLPGLIGEVTFTAEK